jgi:hypothetical protein
MNNVNPAEWRKSTQSDNSGGNCVEVGVVYDVTGAGA